MADWLRHHRREPAQFRLQKTKRLPDVVHSNVIYQIGDNECAWAAALRCPCGCKDVIHLSLVSDAQPSWIIQKHKNGNVTLLPSVRRTVGCKSHFIIYRSRVIWCLHDVDR